MKIGGIGVLLGCAVIAAGCGNSATAERSGPSVPSPVASHPTTPTALDTGTLLVMPVAPVRKSEKADLPSDIVAVTSGGASSMLVHGTAALNPFSASASPDGHVVVFDFADAKGDGGIATVTKGGKPVVVLTPTRGSTYSTPTWDPTGTKVLVTGRSGGEVLTFPDGFRKKAALSNLPGTSGLTGLVWAPGNAVLGTSEDALVLVRDAQARTLFRSNGAFGPLAPVISADGTKVAFGTAATVDGREITEVVHVGTLDSSPTASGSLTNVRDVTKAAPSSTIAALVVDPRGGLIISGFDEVANHVVARRFSLGDAATPTALNLPTGPSIVVASVS